MLLFVKSSCLALAGLFWVPLLKGLVNKFLVSHSIYPGHAFKIRISIELDVYI
jgi:hypothetical protein